MADPVNKNIVKKRVNLESFSDIEYLKSLPQSSLGFKYAQYLTTNDIVQIVPLISTLRTDFHYIMHRIITTHDLYHVLLNKGISIQDEGFVAAFTVSQIPAYTLASFHIAAGILRSATIELSDMQENYTTFVDAWTLGQNVKNLFSIDWNSIVKTDLQEIQKELKLNIQE